MKALYINLYKEKIDSTDSYEVLNYNLLDDFFFYIGDAIVGDTDLQINKIALIENFNTCENASDFDDILRQWEMFKIKLLGEEPNGDFKLIIPKAYREWLRYNKNEKYQSVYEIYCRNYPSQDVCINIDVKKFYEESIGGENGMLLRQIQRLINKSNIHEFKIVLDDTYDIERSLFLNDLRKCTNNIVFKITLKIVKIGDKFGYKDLNGKIIIPAIYDHAWSFSKNGLARVMKDGKYGYLNSKGEIVFPINYDDAGIFAANDLAFIKVNGKYGYMDSDGKIVIPLKYDFATTFNDNGLAQVEKNPDLIWFIDSKGHIIYEDVAYETNGLLRVKKDGKYGFVNPNGDVVIPVQYDKVRYFNNGSCCALKDGKYGYIDKQGNTIIPFVYDEAWSFDDGLNGGNALVLKDNKAYYIDAKGVVKNKC